MNEDQVALTAEPFTAAMKESRPFPSGLFRLTRKSPRVATGAYPADLSEADNNHALASISQEPVHDKTLGPASDTTCGQAEDETPRAEFSGYAKHGVSVDDIHRVDSLPSVGTSFTGPLLLRKTRSEEEESSLNQKQSTAAVIHEPPVTAEVSSKNILTQKPAMIWRKGTVDTSAGTLSSSHSPVGMDNSSLLVSRGISRGGDIAARHPADTTAETPVGPEIHPRNDLAATSRGKEEEIALDLEEVAELVSRLIFRRLEIERERRGVAL